MLLSDTDIMRELKNGNLVIRPLDEKLQIQPASVDLRLSNEFRIFKQTEKSYIDPRKDESEYTERVEIKRGKTLIMHPKEFVLGSTLEYIEIPVYLSARLDGRSSLGRLGLVIHSTAGTVEPGWKGKLTLEISNVGKLPLALYPNMRICQISFYRLESPCKLPKDKRKSK